MAKHQAEIKQLEFRYAAGRDEMAAQMEEMRVSFEQKLHAAQHRTRSGRQSAAMQQFKRIMTRMLKGEGAYRLVVWTQNLLNYKSSVAVEQTEVALGQQVNSNRQLWAEELSRVKQELEESRNTERIRASENAAAICAGALDDRRAASMKQMKQIMQRMLKGSIAVGLHAWQKNSIEGLLQQQSESSKLLEDQILQVWRSEMHSESSSMIQSSKLRSQNAALKSMRLIMTRLLKGAVAQRLIMWKDQSIKSKYGASHNEMQAVLDEQERVSRRLQLKQAGRQQASALKQMKAVLTRFMRGEVAFRLRVVRHKIEADKHRIAMEAQKSAADLKLRSMSDEVVSKMSTMEQGAEYLRTQQLKQTGLKGLRQVMSRLAKGLMAALLVQWLHNTQDWLKESDLNRLSEEGGSVLNARMAEMEQEKSRLARDGDVRTRALKNVHRATAHTAGIQKFGSQLIRMIHDAYNHALRLWLINLQCAFQVAKFEAEIRQNAAMFASQMEQSQDQLSGSFSSNGKQRAVKQMKLAMKRWFNKEIFAKLETWRQQMTDELWAQELYDTQFVLETQLRDNQLQISMKMIGHAFRRLQKGAMGCAVLIWHQNLEQTNVAGQLLSLDQAKEAEKKIAIREKGLAALRLCFARLVRGEVGMRLAVWRNLRNEAERRNRARAERAFESSGGKGNGLGHLHQVFAMLQQLSGDKMILREIMVHLRKLTDQLSKSQVACSKISAEKSTLEFEHQALLAAMSSAQQEPLRLGSLPLQATLQLLDRTSAGARDRRKLAMVCRSLYGVVRSGRQLARWTEQLIVMSSTVPAATDSPLSFDAFQGVTAQWTSHTAKHAPGSRVGASLAVLGQQLYLTGGAEVRMGNKVWPSSKTVSVFQLDTWQWCSARPMEEPRSAHATVVLAGRVYVLGGFDVLDEQPHRSVETFELSAGWEPAAAMPTRRADLAAVCHKGLLYAVGGCNQVGDLRTMECYDPKTLAWTELGGMKEVRSGCSAVSVGCRIVVAGGAAGSVEAYLPARKQWEQLNGLSVPRKFGSAVLMNGCVYIIGGEAQEGSQFTKAPTEVYDAEKDAWSVSVSVGPFGKNLAVMCT